VRQGSVETLYQKRKSAGTDSRSSPDISKIFCPSPAKKPYADAFIVPKFSTATDGKMCILSKPAYLAAFYYYSLPGGNTGGGVCGGV